MKKILIVTDAAPPQVNGVVTTLNNVIKEGRKRKYQIDTFSVKDCFRVYKLPIYKEIDIAFPTNHEIYDKLRNKYDYIHISTIEGPIGYKFAKYCSKNGIKFTTSCHTKFPEFFKARFKWIPNFFVKRMWSHLAKIYNKSESILTTTNSMKTELETKGFKNVSVWTRGVDRSVYYPSDKKKNKKKVLLCVSRVSHEKGLDDFCSLNIWGTKKILVGSGPYLEILKKKYPDVEYRGMLTGEELGDAYREADVFVFPSVNDTFGVVIIEALACSVPVAAYNVTGPKDIIENGLNGYLTDSTLESAVAKCFDLDKEKVHLSSMKWTWEDCWNIFEKSLVKCR